jgi:hypothetical protein
LKIDELSASGKTHESSIKRQIKVIVEKHYRWLCCLPIGLKDVVVAQGDSYQEVLDEIKSAINFHIETFGKEIFDSKDVVIEVFVVETSIAMLTCTIL